MQAIVCTQYGPPDLIKLKEVDKPSPKENEVLIKIIGSSVNAADWHMMRADPFIVRFFGGLFKPKFKILGADIAGVVEEVGSAITNFKIGDEVFGDLAQINFGGFAEYVCAVENLIALKPTNLSFEEAAAVPLAAVSALQGLRDKGKIEKGQQVLINGASGGVGTYAVQIAKAFEAEVTAVCSTGKIDMVRSIGADHVIDYTKENFTKSGKRYDLILAANGYHSIFDYKRVLKPNGRYVMIGGKGKQMAGAMFIGPIISMFGKKKLGFVAASANQNDLIFLTKLIEAGKVKPVIDRIYKLSDVADAIRYLEEGHAIGKIVIKNRDDQ